MRVCHDSPSQDRSANTSTGDATALRTPRPSTRSTFTRSTTPARLSGRPLGGSTARGSDATTPRTDTVARWSARSWTGPASRTPDVAASPARASAVASAARVIVPTHAVVNRARVRREDLIRCRQTIASPAATTVEPAASAITQTGGAPSERATPVQAVRAGTSRRRSAAWDRSPAPDVAPCGRVGVAWSMAGHQTLTFGRSCSSSLSPIPLTSPSSSTEENRPCC